MATKAEQVIQSAREVRAGDMKVVERANAMYEDRMKGKPTPNQEECDLIKLGAPLKKKAKSGAGRDPIIQRQMEARQGSGGGYATRAATPRAGGGAGASASSS